MIGSKSWKLVEFSLLMDVERRNYEVPETLAQEPGTNLASVMFRRYDKIMEITLSGAFQVSLPHVIPSITSE